jgi:hypothetical protein
MGEAADDLWSNEFDRACERQAFVEAVERNCLKRRPSCDYDLHPDDDGLLTCRVCGEQFDYP